MTLTKVSTSNFADSVSHIRKKLSLFDQEHLLDHWDSITESQQAQLLSDISEIDLEQVMHSFHRLGEISHEKLDERMQPLTQEQCGSAYKTSPEEKAALEQIGYKYIASGKVAILLLAGGQGTRLGVDYPKGMFDVGLLSGKSLFQLQAERILKLMKLAEKRTGILDGFMTWYIMTSSSTLEPTLNFFKRNKYFGLNSENVVLFQQGTLPCFSMNGKILMASKYEIARAPDGNGGLYRALKVNGILEDMKKRTIEYVQSYCVDNILVRVGDPLFMGYCINKGAECANKVVAKVSPTEAVGVTCNVDGGYQVVEYSEITSGTAERRNSDGSLTFSAANICIHFFTREFLQQVVDIHERFLIHHTAKKKIPYMDPKTCQLITPLENNGIKMEKFVFDVFRFANNFVVWECVREDEFSPLKNADNKSAVLSDSGPTSCKLALYALHQRWVIAAGGNLVEVDRLGCESLSSTKSLLNSRETNNNDATERNVVPIEISPMVSYAGEGLEDLVRGKDIIVPSCSIGL